MMSEKQLLIGSASRWGKVVLSEEEIQRKKRNGDKFVVIRKNCVEWVNYE